MHTSLPYGNVHLCVHNCNVCISKRRRTSRIKYACIPSLLRVPIKATCYSVTKDESEAHRELIHFQNAYPSDPRAFFSTRRARQVGTSVLQRLRTKFQSQERDVEVALNEGSGYFSLLVASKFETSLMDGVGKAVEQRFVLFFGSINGPK